MTVHCLFEQSGTFKNEFINLGFSALDYDICNDFSQTDIVIDLFSEIVSAANSLPSIFDSFTADDLVFAFFPCNRFESQISLWLSGNNFSQRDWSDSKKISYAVDLEAEVFRNYSLFSFLILIAIERGFKLIIENPYSSDHFLVRYFPVKASFIDFDRSINGDYFKKPTQYWFINCVPKHNLIFEPLSECDSYRVCDCHGIKRSLFHPQYAHRFILQHIIDL